MIAVARLHFYDSYFHSVHEGEFDPKLTFLSDKMYTQEYIYVYGFLEGAINE
jgi:hypothetical protein